MKVRIIRRIHNLRRRPPWVFWPWRRFIDMPRRISIDGMIGRIDRFRLIASPLSVAFDSLPGKVRKGDIDGSQRLPADGNGVAVPD